MGTTPTADSSPELADLIHRGRLIPASDTTSPDLPPYDAEADEIVWDLREDRL
jgi:hypothetical protein